MAGTLIDMYLKYRNKVERAMEDDNYYNYMMGLISEAPNEIEQFNRVLHKKVDEKWLREVEAGIPALMQVISNPRRFIKAEEEIVPVELAKKITADSVKHLARNTQFISDIDKNGNVRPSKIMSVTTQESFNLYENRFIYHLVNKLVRFIDKRTDIIFWSTGDEQESVLRINSELEDDYEEIEYKIEMRIKNKQSFAQTDALRMELFQRIDRVRKSVTELKRSPFMREMDGCETVRSPIMKTNLLTKDPYYRRCYALWQFLEQYDDVGYTIDIKESALDFDEDYLYGMYDNMVMNYATFKTILADDQRPIADTLKKKRRIKPRFTRQMVEEIVDDYDIPDVEIRKVIIEEITKKQAEIERKAAAREKARLEREKKKAAEREKREKQKQIEREKKEKAAAAERERIAKQKAAEKARIEKQKAAEKAKLERQKQLEKERAAKAKAAAAEKERIAKQKAAEKARLEKQKAAEKARLEKQKQLEKERAAKAKAAALAKAKAEKEKAAAKAKAEREKAAAKAKAEREKAAAKA
ncbi:MAG: hypothetical protein J5622_03475, partial [Firmicutes bacterium]|nr:hypothetical protein [Bacillota bacterium]